MKNSEEQPDILDVLQEAQSEKTFEGERSPETLGDTALELAEELKEGEELLLKTQDLSGLLALVSIPTLLTGIGIYVARILEVRSGALGSPLDIIGPALISVGVAMGGVGGIIVGIREALITNYIFDLREELGLPISEEMRNTHELLGSDDVRPKT